MKAEDRIENKFIEEHLDFNYVRPDDLRLVSSLLTEYSDKLESTSTKRLNLQRKLKLIQFFSPTIGGFLFLSFYLATWHSKNILTAFNGSFLLSLIAFFLMIYLIVYYWHFLEGLKRKIRESTKYGQRIALRLEKLVRLGSQLYEVKVNSIPVEVPTQMFARIELDFCLADAEAALEVFRNSDQHNKQ